MPEFLSPQENNSILNSDNERGQGMGQGSEKGMHQGGGQENSNDQQMGPRSKKGNGKRGAGRCPGMWIAGLLFLVMVIQSVFFRTPTPSTIPATESASQPMEVTEISNTPQ